VILRPATPADAPGILAIYAPIVENTVISFEYEPPSVDEMVHRLEAYRPWLVAVDNGEIMGYAYASKHRERAAYQWSADVSVYVHELARGQGLGTRLYRELFAVLVGQGYVNAYAGITLPNPASVGLHESLGFRPVGVYEGVGYKFGAWHDVGWWQLLLRPHPPSS